MRDQLIDRIYEAAFLPELWPSVLDDMGALSGSASGAMLIFAKDQPPRWQATALVQASLQEFCTTDAWRQSERAPHLFEKAPTGFTFVDDHLTADQIERDSVHRNLQALGLGWQVSTLIPIPSGEIVAFTVERWLGDGRHGAAAISALDGLRPHLARASLLSARLGLGRAETAVATLEAVGFPAAVLDASGRVLTANSLLEALSTRLMPSARGGLTLAAAAANVLFRQAVRDAQSSRAAVVRSIPVAGGAGQPAIVVHVLPLRGAAHDIFTGATTLVVATPVGTNEMVPGPALLNVVFDLSPAEARLAVALASGRSLKEAAVDLGIRPSTARSYIEQVLRKTGTHQQSQLVALLKSVQPPFRGS